jgi:type VI secretion system protein ImpC
VAKTLRHVTELAEEKRRRSMARGRAFVLGVVGSFAGSRSAQAPPGDVDFREVDRDDFDRSFGRVVSEIALDLPFCRSVTPKRFEDLQPDGLIERVPALGKLIEARAAVGSPEAMARHLEQAGVDLVPDSAEPTLEPGAADPAEPGPALEDGAILDSILDGGASAPRPRRARSSGDPEFDRLVQEIADASADSTDYAQQDRWRAAIDAELERRMRAILACPAFRALESSWTSLRGLVWKAETGPDLRIRLADLPQSALSAGLEQTRKLEESSLYRAVVDPDSGLPGGEPFGALLTDYTFGTGAGDLALLTHLTELAERARIPILAALSDPAAVAEASAESGSAWEELRRRPGARYIGLCAPRLLLRAPYGRDTSPVESFPFEEGAAVERPDSYLWGSSAFGLARAVVSALSEYGALGAVERFLALEGLPIHVYRAQGEVQYQGPTEAYLSESRIEAWSGAGIIPVTAVRGQDSARITSLRSLAGTYLFADA